MTRAAKTHQAGHMRLAGRVFETPALKATYKPINAHKTLFYNRKSVNMGEKNVSSRRNLNKAECGSPL